jgi:hypothetical protein
MRDVCAARIASMTLLLGTLPSVEGAALGTTMTTYVPAAHALPQVQGDSSASRGVTPVRKAEVELAPPPRSFETAGQRVTPSSPQYEQGSPLENVVEEDSDEEEEEE